MESKYDIVYDETIVSYMELYCFLGAYFQYATTSYESKKQAVNEVVDFCTPSYIQRVVSQIETLLVTYDTSDEALLMWLSRITNGHNYNTADEARTYLKELQKMLKSALYEKQQKSTPQQLSYATQ